MLYSDATVESVYTTADGDQPASYAIVNGELHGDDGLVHFAVPFRHWYDDLVHNRATMLLFRSEEEIDRWCAATGEPRGEAVPLRTVWDLSKLWYGNRMSPASAAEPRMRLCPYFDSLG